MYSSNGANPSFSVQFRPSVKPKLWIYVGILCDTSFDSFLLYQYTCDTCNCVYIGETKRHFQVRAYEHLGMSIKTDKAYAFNENTATAVCKHSHDLGHQAGMENFKIIGHASSKYHLLLKEALVIGLIKPIIINVQKFSLPLELFGNWHWGWCPDS